MHGYHGRYVLIDARTGQSRTVPLKETILRRFLGGVGLGTWIVAQETRPCADPLEPESSLVFALSPLVGSPLTTSAKFAVVAFSPLTGRLCDALSSSHFALAAKRAGVDAIAVTGQADRWSVLFVEEIDGDPVARFLSADHLLGRTARETEECIRADHGRDWQVIAIGPAGENLIPFANLSHDGRHAGRGGLGAVLGSKRLKALAVRGGQRSPLADPDRAIALAKTLSTRSFGPATEKYRELGTVANLLVFNRFDALPTRNFTAGHFEGADRLAAEDLAPARRIARNSCACCTIGCEHIYPNRPGGNGVRMEYETLFALGPLCGVSDPAALLDAAAACDAAGLDTISTGGTIAFAMDCAERGLLAPSDTLPSGRALRFGDARAVLEAIPAIVRREGLGALLALGSRRAAEHLGGPARARAMHVKGLELPGYDPRSLQTMALGLAVSTRGADHNRSSAYEADFSDRTDRRLGGPHSARLAIETENRAALIDSLILCKFLRGIFTDLFAEAAPMLAAVTGWDVTAEELHTTASRIVIARRALNQREGWTRGEDTLPDGLLDGDECHGLSRERLDTMIRAYYQLRGCEEDGRVPTSLRAQLDLLDPAFGP